MKAQKIKLFVSVLLLSIAFGCEDDEGPDTFQFEATFFTKLTGFAEDKVACSSPKSFLNTQVGSGTATRLGDFTTTITFCVDPNTLAYNNSEGSFMAANGDALFFEGEGQVKPSDHPDYDLEFQDTVIITGGSGQFEGASGTLTTDSYVKNTTQQTDHVWSGTITINE